MVTMVMLMVMMMSTVVAIEDEDVGGGMMEIRRLKSSVALDTHRCHVRSPAPFIPPPTPPYPYPLGFLQKKHLLALFTQLIKNEHHSHVYP